jgi:hypothetical protein
MAARNGINVSSIPFERRYQPPDPRRRRRERLTATDRLVCAVCGAFLGFVLWTFGYLILVSGAMKAAARQAPPAQGPVDPLAKLPPFWWGGPAALGFALFGAVVGAERMMDGFEKALRAEGAVARAVNRS